MINKFTIDQHLGTGGVSAENYRAYMDGGIYENYVQIPKGYLSIFEKDSSGTRPYNYIGLINGQKKWVIETLQNLQPFSYDVFEEKAGPLLLGLTLISDPLHPHTPPEPYPYLFFDICGRMIEVMPTFAGSTYEDGNHCSGTLLSIPEELSKSWLWRTDGWRIPSELPEYVMTNRQLIGHPFSSWKKTDSYLDTLGRGYKKKYLSKIIEMFPDTLIKPKTPYEKNLYCFECFLDTRPSNINGPVGDQFFVCSTRQDKIVYHIHRGDVDNIRILHNPAEAIDRYCAHTLLRTPSEFDFMPWSEPLPA